MHRLLNKFKAAVHTQPRHLKINEELRREIRKNNFVQIKRMVQLQGLVSDQMRGVFRIRNQAEQNQAIFEQLRSCELRELAVALQFIGSAQRKIRGKIIGLQTYKRLTSTYFSQFLSSNSSRVHPISRFIYLQNNSIRTDIKRSQIKMIESLSDRRLIDPLQFASIINLELFNITDMPTIYQLFYQIYFPSLSNISNIRQSHQTLIYLSSFRKIPFFLPRKIIQIIEQELSTNPYLYYQHFLEINNIIFLLLFKFTATINELRLKSTLEHLYRQLLDKPIVDQETRNQIEGSIQDLQLTFLKLKCLNINQLITSFEHRKTMLLQQNDKINQALNLKVDEKQKQKLCINMILNQQSKSIQKLLDNQANQLLHKTFLEFKIKQCRSLILASTMPMVDPSVLYDFIADQKIFKLFKKNVCVPQLQKSLQIAQSRMKEKGKDRENHKKSNFDKLCKNLKNRLDKLITSDKINKFAEELIKTQQTTRKDLPIIYSAPFQEVLWSTDDLFKLSELHSEYDLSKDNVLYLLKNDPEYLLSLINWNISGFIYNFYLPKQFKSLGFSTEPCKYTEGVGFKVIKENQKKPIILKIQSELNKNVVSDEEKTGYILRGGVRNIIRTLRRLKKNH